MSYRHKRTSALKRTREILEDYEYREESKYGLPQVGAAINQTAKREGAHSEPEEEANRRTEGTGERPGQEIPIPPMPVNEAEFLEEYVPIEEASFEVEATKEKIEKKRKRRNYREFRSEYENG
ncbi:MAG: hypothetical protein AM324_012065 [Candidatus Thorarchaeota archaeon SMTZ1-83]|nr:MAG: hypothetical protein AM324_13280 [Candidatus Thorarchaeota archaeon SMTZ1-83]